MSFYKFKKSNMSLDEPHALYLKEMISSIKEKDLSIFEIVFVEKKNFPRYPKVFLVDFENLENVYLYYGSECEKYIIRQYSTNRRWEYLDFESFSKAVINIGNISSKKLYDVRDLQVL